MMELFNNNEIQDILSFLKETFTKKQKKKLQPPYMHTNAPFKLATLNA